MKEASYEVGIYPDIQLSMVIYPVGKFSQVYSSRLIFSVGGVAHTMI